MNRFNIKYETLKESHWETVVEGYNSFVQFYDRVNELKNDSTVKGIYLTA